MTVTDSDTVVALDASPIPQATPDGYVLPDYSGPCVSGVVPALLGPPDEMPSWMPSCVTDADRVVLLVLDGLGWEQFVTRRSWVKCLGAMDGRAITTVVPSTTATALTSIATGTPPAEHGVVGYRVAIDHEVLNILRWTTPRGDARFSIPPRSVGLVDPFESERPPIVMRAEFEYSGFTEAHLRTARFNGYRTMSTLAIEVVRLVKAGEPFVYAYYDGIDKVAHEYGLGVHYDGELTAIDWMVEYLVEELPAGTALVVTADHGQVDVSDRVLRPHPAMMSHVDFQSGEGRFRWYHAFSGSAAALLDAATEHHSDVAWVVSRERVLDEAWFGPKMADAVVDRLGDVAVVARDDIAFDDPADTGPYDLIGRHGSITSAEMLVPLLAIRR